MAMREVIMNHFLPSLHKHKYRINILYAGHLTVLIFQCSFVYSGPHTLNSDQITALNSISLKSVYTHTEQRRRPVVRQCCADRAV